MDGSRTCRISNDENYGRKVKKKIFSTHGIPKKLVSDNGSVFTSQEFTNFVKSNGIDHIKTAPYHPSSNGLAERAVQVLKKGLSLAKQGTLSYRLTQVLFSYRITPHSMTGISPAELLMGRKLQSRLDLLHPNLEQTVHKKQWQQKQFYKGNRNSMIDLYNGVRVYVRNYNRGRPWVAGVVQSKNRPPSYTIKLDDGRVVKQHLDQIRKTLESERHEGGEAEDLLAEPIHPRDNPCSRAMVPVSPGRPEEWAVAPDLPEQDGVDKQMEQDAMVSSPEISTGPENLETYVEPTTASKLGASKGATPSHRSSRRRKAPDRLNF